MMTSSGSGSYRIGGSLSSSNLSPLAPPFKVDKSLLKSNSMNPSVNFSDGPVYGTCFDPAPGQIWNSSSSSVSVPQCVATESVVANTNCSSAPNMYAYQDSQSSTSSAYYGSTNHVSAYDPFTYEPFPNSICSNTEEAAKPFYPSFASPPSQKDGYLSLGVASGPSYDLLSYSGPSHLGRSGVSQSDHPQAVSGDKGYKSKWGYFQSGLNESNHEEWADYAKGFVPKDLNMTHLSSNKSPLFIDGSNKNQPSIDVNNHPFVDGSNKNLLFSGVTNKNHVKQGAYVTQDQGLHGQAPSIKDNCFDIFGGVYSLGSLGIDQQNCKPSSKCSKTRTSAFASGSRECPHFEEPPVESVSSFCGSKKETNSTPDDRFSQASFYMFGCASTPNTTKLPNIGSSSSVEGASSAVKVNFMGTDAANQSYTTAVGYTSSSHMEPQMPLGLKCHSSIRIRRPVPSKAASSCKKLENSYGRFDDKGAYEKISTSPLSSQQLSVDGLNIEASDVEAAYSVEKHSGGSEGHNPAEDSPCWRGASSKRFSPFEQSESVASDEKLDKCRTLSSQDLQDNVNTFNSKDNYAGKVKKFNLVGKPSSSDCSSNDNGDLHSANPKYRCFDLNSGCNLHFADDCPASTVGCNMVNKSKADLAPKDSLAEQLNLEAEISSARNITEAPSSEKRRNNTPVAVESLSGLPSNIDSISISLPVNEASMNPANENSDSRMDVNVLLRTMMNLSEIFRSHCSSNRAEIEEKHSLAIKQIVNNLNASILMTSGQKLPITVLSSPDTSLPKEFHVGQMCGSQVNDAEALAASMKLGRTTEVFLDNNSLNNGRNSFGDVNMAEAAKKLLSENLQEEEMDNQKLLYKNLWLEAEASLSVMTAKARFMRMKSDMKRTRDEAKDKDNPRSLNFSADIHRTVEVATEAKDAPSLGENPGPTTNSQYNHSEESNIPNSQASSPNIPKNETSRLMETYIPFHGSRPGAHSIGSDDSLTTSNANDVEACVMARYQILQNRVGFSDSLIYEGKQYSGEHKCPSTLYESVNSFHASGTTMKTNDLETSEFGGYQILKSLDNSDYLNSKGDQLPGDENYLPDIGSSSPDEAFQDSEMSNSLGVIDERESSVIARFRILQSRIDHSDLGVNGSSPIQQVNTVMAEGGTEEMGSSQRKCKINISSFGPYPRFAEDEDVNVFKIGVNGQTTAPTVNTNRMSSEIFEGWYDNDCSSSDWEHISRVDV